MISTGADHENIGGLVGINLGSVVNCCSTGSVAGQSDVGGLVGYNGGRIITSYSTGIATGEYSVGGLVGHNSFGGSITSSFWDFETSDRVTSSGGTGLTTAEMQDINTFLNAGGDFMGETVNGTEDIWWILDGQNYP